MRPMWAVFDALRGLRSGRSSTVLAFVVLSLTMAAGTVTFSVVDAVAIRPAPYAAPEQLVDLALRGPTAGTRFLASPQDFVAWRERASATLASLGAARLGSTRLEIDGTLVPLSSARVTTHLFDVLGVVPALGRLFGPEHAHAGGQGVAIISHALWVSRFGADPAVLGRQLKSEGGAREVIGVLPEHVWYPITIGPPPDVYLPYAIGAADRSDNRCCVFVVGRLRPGFSVEQARAEIQGMSSAVVVSVQDQIVGSEKASLVLVLAAVGFLLVLACANTATALLARTATRAPEFATRAALGASRGQLAAGVLVEAVSLAVASAAVGLVLSFGCVEIVKTSLPPGLTRVSTIAVNARVMIASMVAAIVCGSIFGAAPAWFASRSDLAGSLKVSAAIVGGRRSRALAAFLITNIALASVVLVATALVVATFVRLTTADVGFARQNLMAIGYEQPLTALPRTAWPAASAVIRADVLERVRTVPGVVDAAISVGGALPFSGAGGSVTLFIPGVGRTSSDRVEFDRVTPEYFRTMGMRLVRGRTFTSADTIGAQAVMLINDVAARLWFADRDPIGQDVVLDGPATIIGVVRGVQFDGPENDVPPAIYTPAGQTDLATVSGTAMGVLIVRTRDDPRARADAVRNVVRPALTVEPGEPRFIEDGFRRLTAARRFNAGLMMMFGVFALVAGAAGIYGTAAFVATRQVRTIGLRMALGATPSSVRSAVMRQSLTWVGAGTAIGFLASRATSNLLASLVFGVRPTDPLVYLAVGGVLAAVGSAATLLPAIRAARVDPAIILRQ